MDFLWLQKEIGRWHKGAAFGKRHALPPLKPRARSPDALRRSLAEAQRAVQLRFRNGA